MQFIVSAIVEFVIKKLLAFGWWLFFWKRQETIGEKLAKAHDEAVKKGIDSDIEKTGADVLNGSKS